MLQGSLIFWSDLASGRALAGWLASIQFSQAVPQNRPWQDSATVDRSPTDEQTGFSPQIEQIFSTATLKLYFKH